MAKKINLRSSKVKAQKRQVQTYGTQTPLSSAAVERGSTRWLNGSTVFIEGLLDVTGQTTISGALNVSGTSTFSGALTIAGPTGITGPLTVQGVTTISGKLDVTGPTTLNGKLDIGGNTTITGTFDVTGLTKLKGDTTVEGKFDVTGAMATKGTLSVEGITTLKNNLNVDQGKKISLGGLVLENQGTSSAQVQMPGGGISASTALGMSLNHNSIVVAAQTSAEIAASNIKLTAPIVNVSSRLDVAGQLRVAGSVIIFSALPTTASPPNLYATAGGTLYRSTATP